MGAGVDMKERRKKDVRVLIEERKHVMAEVTRGREENRKNVVER